MCSNAWALCYTATKRKEFFFPVCLFACFLSSPLCVYFPLFIPITITIYFSTHHGGESHIYKPMANMDCLNSGTPLLLLLLEQTSRPAVSERVGVHGRLTGGVYGGEDEDVGGCVEAQVWIWALRCAEKVSGRGVYSRVDKWYGVLGVEFPLPPVNIPLQFIGFTVSR